MNTEEKQTDLINKLILLKEIKPFTMRRLAIICGVSDAGVINWSNNRTIKYVNHADKIAESLGMNIEQLHEISKNDFIKYLKELKKEFKKTKKVKIFKKHESKIIPIKVSNVKSVYDESDLNKNEVMISMYNVTLSAGGGCQVPEFIEIEGQRAFSLNWMQKKGLKQKNLILMKVVGESMQPVLNEHDTVLIDTSNKEIVDGKVYALVIGVTAKIKRLKRTYDGDLIIRSYNPHIDHADEIIKSKDLDKIYIIGLAVHKSRDI